MTKPLYSADIDGLGRWTSLYRDGKWIQHRDFYDPTGPHHKIEGDEAEQMYLEFAEARRVRLEGEKQ